MTGPPPPSPPPRPGAPPPGPTLAAPPPGAAPPVAPTVATPPGGVPRPFGPGVALPPGAPSIGRFVVLAELARGGMGAVLRCWDPQLRVERAVKVLTRDASDPGELERFQREARVLARLRHPHIIGIQEAGVHAGTPFVVLPLVEGGSLAGLLQREGPLAPRRAAELLDRVARAVDFAHGEGVVHRDLKPANVLLDREGQPLVTDFGIARDRESQEALTRTGQLMGTPQYMAPEQAGGEKDRVGPRTDVYALGAILYELLAGRPPFVGEAVMAVITAVLTREPPALRALRPEVPADLAAIVHQALSKAPEERYDSAAAFAADLRRFLAGQPVAARRLGPAARAGRWAARHPVAVALVVAAGAAAAGLGGAALAEARAGARRARALAWHDEAVAHLASARPAEAAEALARAVALDAACVPAWRTLAGRALVEGRVADAAAAVARLEALHPGDPASLALGGRVALRAGDAAAAAARLRRAVAAGLDDPPTRLEAAAACLAAGEPGRALEVLGALATADAERARVRAWELLGAARSADRARWAVLRADPGDAAALAGLVDARLAAVDLEGLEGLWDECLRELEAPGDTPPLRLLEGQAAEVQADLEAAAADGPGPADLRRAIRAALAAVVVRRPGLRAPLERLAEGRGGPVVAGAARAALLGVGAWTAEAWAAALPRVDDAAAAATLADLAPRLPDGPALLRAAAARGAPRTRAAAALTAARLALRGGDDDGAVAEGLTLLEGLAGDAAPAVAACARAAAAALRLVAGRGEGDPPDGALALALALADPLRAVERAARAPDAARVAVLRALGRPGGDRAVRALLLARAAAEDGDPVVALERARGAAAATPRPLAARALQASLAAGLGRADEAREALAALEALDPAGAAEARRRAEVAARGGLVALPRPGGATRVVVHATTTAALGRAFAVESAGAADVPGGGVATRRFALLRARFRLRDATGARVDLRLEPPEGGLLLQVSLDAPADDLVGRTAVVATPALGNHQCRVDLDGLCVATEERFAPRELHGALVEVRRDRTSVVAFGRDDDGPVHAVREVSGPTLLRLGAPGDDLVLSYGWGDDTQAAVLGRVVVDGVLVPAPWPGDAAFAGRDDLVRAPDALAVAPPRRQDGAPLVARHAPRPATLGELRRGGLLLPAEGQYVGAHVGAPVVALGPLRGAVRVAATVALDGPTPDASAGVGVRGAGRPDRAFAFLLDDRAAPPGAWAVGLYTQRGLAWELPRVLAAGPRAGAPARLVLERVGDRLRATCDGRALGEVGLPLADPVEVVLFARGAGGRAARFSDVDVWVEPPR